MDSRQASKTDAVCAKRISCWEIVAPKCPACTSSTGSVSVHGCICTTAVLYVGSSWKQMIETRNSGDSTEVGISMEMEGIHIKTTHSII